MTLMHLSIITLMWHISCHFFPYVPSFQLIAASLQLAFTSALFFQRQLFCDKFRWIQHISHSEQNVHLYH